jgi:hypothetical protein
MLVVFFPYLSPGGKKQVMWCFPGVSDILSTVWIIVSPILVWHCRVGIPELFLCTCWLSSNYCQMGNLMTWIGSTFSSLAPFSNFKIFH